MRNKTIKILKWIPVIKKICDDLRIGTSGGLL
jgi:hypothetical protein